MRALIVDDKVERIDFLRPKYQEIGYKVYWAKSVQEAKGLVNIFTFDLISVDHDLACFDRTGKELNGATLTRWMGWEGHRCQKFVVHSANPVGSQNILSIARSAEIAPEIRWEPAVN